MTIKISQENEHAIQMRLMEKPHLTTATKLVNYLLSLGIIYDNPKTRKRVLTQAQLNRTVKVLSKP